MPVFPGSRPASVTPDPEIVYTGPLKSVFPGSRPTSVTRHPEHEGDTNARKGHFPTSSVQATADKLRDRDTAQTNNASYGGERGESGINGPLKQGAFDAEHDTAGDGVGVRNKPSTPTIGAATGGNTQVSVAFTPGAIRGRTYTVVVSPGGKTNSGSSSPIVVTGLTNSTAYTAKVYATNELGDSAQSAASNSFTPA